MHTKTLHLEDLGDYIGMESCVDLKADMDETKVPIHHHFGGGGGGKRREKRENAFPPPISWLARTGNLPSHMPWVLKRYYPGDGRLIVREEKVRHHECFRAHRANGRLTLHLIPSDDDVLSAGEEEEEEEEEQVVQKEEKMESLVCFDKNGEDPGKNGDSDHSMNKGTMIIPEDNILVKDCGGVGVIGGGGGGGGEKWCKFDGVRLSLCMYGMPVPAIGPVQT